MPKVKGRRTTQDSQLGGKQNQHAVSPAQISSTKRKRKSEIYVLTCPLTHVYGVTCAYVYIEDRDQHELPLEVALFIF